ncbi:MAG: dTDP-4-dehydrorhamnose 3,5-epimerase [Cytophagales bacterium]|nr:MAG: dTDP-4-dehydrorhamnose 3,5-epimerase [Cytophagales bacterium]
MIFRKVEGFEGLWLIEPRVFEDNRGYFYESYNQKSFEAAVGFVPHFVQDNHSFSTKGVMRGLHFQKPPFAQAKLVRVVQGSVLDVVVDLRQKSPSFGTYFGVELSAENKKQLYIPEGFAHGFVVLSDSAELIYKCNQFYNPAHEGGIRFDDPALRIDWGYQPTQMIVSEKDKALPFLETSFSYF